MEDREKLSLLSIRQGALIEQFDRALELVVVNLSDINTTTKIREINLTVKVKTNTDRTFLEIEGGVKTKLAGQEPIGTTADLTFDNHGRPVALCRRPRQQEIPFNVTRLNEKGEK
jgi:hypothetical protein